MQREVVVTDATVVYQRHRGKRSPCSEDCIAAEHLLRVEIDREKLCDTVRGAVARGAYKDLCIRISGEDLADDLYECGSLPSSRADYCSEFCDTP